MPKDAMKAIHHVVHDYSNLISAGTAIFQTPPPLPPFNTHVQEAFLVHRLGQQVSDLRRQDALIGAQNQGYHKDITAITSGAASEEEARLNGYSRPSEKLYLVNGTPSPAAPKSTPSASPSSPKPTP